MEILTNKPFQIVYSLYQHQYLGYMFESFVVQLDDKGNLTLRHQNISSMNAREFASGLDETDYELIKLMDAMHQNVVLRKFSTKKQAAADFFAAVFDPEKTDKTLATLIEEYMENRRAKILQLLLKGKMLFEMANDGEPTHKPISIEPEAATILFHFLRNEGHTQYFPTIKHKGQKLEFCNKGGIVICNQPAWMLLNGQLFHFEGPVDGKKLRPFANKRFIVIPEKLEAEYYRKFIAQTLENFEVHAKGFRIHTVEAPPQPVLSVTEMPARQVAGSLFPESGKGVHGSGNGTQPGEDGAPVAEEDAQMVVHLRFRYGHFQVPSELSSPVRVEMTHEQEQYTFYKVVRQMEHEQRVKQRLRESGMEIRNGRIVLPRGEVFSWLSEQRSLLEEHQFDIQQTSKNGKTYFIGETVFSLEIVEGNDWFDIQALVRFGDFEIPFMQIRRLIVSGKREFTLPNGEIAVIPEAWFQKYSDLFHFIEEEQHRSVLKKHHFGVVDELRKNNDARVTISQRLEALKDFQQIEDYELPKAFQGTLRPYQKGGYNWMRFLDTYQFGGCLADDMGLGKTVQTLALLQAQHDMGIRQPSLLIMPTSLLYNWEKEAARFTPQLKVFCFTGTNRPKDPSIFQHYDLILTSYGITRIDVELLKQFYFNYIILDESQVIKNPASIIARTVRQLRSRNRLILTGTPIENTTMDLWSQISFVNPGLLGTQGYFRKEYQNPIEKRQDIERIQKLHTMVKPFIMRRHKSQVATDLPEKTETVQYSDMTEEQAKLYEQVKSQYRNEILDQIEKVGLGKSQFMLLKGLTMLRQIANHPLLLNPEYQGSSGKMDDVLYALENAIGEDHKILIFSQFVKHLHLFRQHLDRMKIRYAYLDGSTKDRMKEVEQFQQSDQIPVFLISLKAGGLGLNLTAADYVFLLDPWWNPAAEAQATDRAHRIGQTNNVMIYKFITRNTVEEKILALQEKKKSLASNLITTEESFFKTLTKEDIEALLA